MSSTKGGVGVGVDIVGRRSRAGDRVADLCVQRGGLSRRLVGHAFALRGHLSGRFNAAATQLRKRIGRTAGKVPVRLVRDARPDLRVSVFPGRSSRATVVYAADVLAPLLDMRVRLVVRRVGSFANLLAGNVCATADLGCGDADFARDPLVLTRLPRFGGGQMRRMRGVGMLAVLSVPSRDGGPRPSGAVREDGRFRAMAGIQSVGGRRLRFPQPRFDAGKVLHRVGPLGGEIRFDAGEQFRRRIVPAGEIG